MWLNSWLSSDTCNRIVETANSLPLLTKICKFKQISGKKTLFSSTNYFFLLRLCFFFSFPTSFFNFYFSFYSCTILLSISDFFQTCALFSISYFLKTGVYIHVNHNHYNLLKCDWWSNFFIFRELFCRVVIGQCDWTVGCKRTPVIR